MRQPRNSLAVWVLVMTAISGCGGAARPRVTPAPSPPGAPRPAVIHVGTLIGGQRHVAVLPLEEYVLAAVLSELSPASSDPGAVRRMFAVQAIVARTYAVAHLTRHIKEGFNLCDTTHCQLVNLQQPRSSRWARTARSAVQQTRGALVQHGGKPAQTYFHADCGGHRSAALDVWGGSSVAYLRGGPDPLPGGRAHAPWSVAIDVGRLRQALNAGPRTRVGNRLDSIVVQRRDAAGRAVVVVLNGERAPVVRGEELRAALTAAFGPGTLRSSLFEVRREQNSFVFAGRGFGHGVGLCQAGAMVRAAAGETPERILAFYFPGTLLSIR